MKANKPVIGAICPKRKDEPEFNVYFESSRRVTVENGLVPVDGIGMAVTLIRRDALTAMIATGKVRRDPGAFPEYKVPKGACYGFFDPVANAEGHRFPEDISFCLRWRELCQGEVWGLVTNDIGHTGDKRFTGEFPGIKPKQNPQHAGSSLKVPQA